jgi:NADH:ubiquinone oxidoreductase subunit 4 (subunit M)
MRLIDGVVLVPFILVILLFALYPQLELHRAEKSVTATVAGAQAAAARGAPQVAEVTGK